MSQHRFHSSTLIALTTVWLLLISTGQNVDVGRADELAITTIQFAGQQAVDFPPLEPGNFANYHSFGLPYITSNGRIGFQARLSSNLAAVPFDTRDGFWTTSIDAPTTSQLAYRWGIPAPDTDWMGGGDPFHAPTPLFNGSGNTRLTPWGITTQSDVVFQGGRFGVSTVAGRPPFFQDDRNFLWKANANGTFTHSARFVSFENSSIDVEYFDEQGRAVMVVDQGPRHDLYIGQTLVAAQTDLPGFDTFTGGTFADGFGREGGYVFTPGDDLLFQSRATPTAGSPLTGIYRAGNGPVATVVQTGNTFQLPDGHTVPLTSLKIATSSGYGIQTTPSALGEAAFIADYSHEGRTQSGVFVASNPALLRSMVLTGEQIPAIVGNRPTNVILSLLDDLLVDSNGTIFFEARAEIRQFPLPFKSANFLWRMEKGKLPETIIRSGDVAISGPGEDIKFTDRFSLRDVNSAGELVFTARLDRSHSQVTSATDDVLMVFLPDPLEGVTGATTMLAREGAQIPSRSAGELFGFPNARRGGAISNDGQVAFLSGNSGVMLAEFKTTSVLDFIWSGLCGDDNWHSDACLQSNWNEFDTGEPAKRSPGDGGGVETATIVDALVQISDRAVRLKQFNIGGSLMVNQPLTVEEGLYVGGNETGAGQPGTISVMPGVTLAVGERLRVYPGSTLLIDDGTVTLEVGPIVAASPLAVGPLAAAAPPPAAQFDNQGNVEFKSGGTINGPAPLLIGSAATLKKTGGPSKTAIVNAEIRVADGGQIIVQQGTLSLRGSGKFRGTNGMIEIGSGATLSLASRDAKRKVYEVVSGKQTTVGGGKMVVGDNATLSIASGAEFVNELELQLEGTGSIDVTGTFRNKKLFEWKGGRIGTILSPGGQFVNERSMGISSSATKTLTGELVNNRVVIQDADITLDGGNIVNNDGWIVHSGDIKKGGDGGVFTNKDEFVLFHLVKNKTTKIEVHFDNQGEVRIDSLITDVSTKLILSDVKQVIGNALTGGSWDVREKSVLDFEGKTIKQIGNTDPKAAKTKVILRGGSIERFELEEIRKTGTLTIGENQSVILPGALANRGELTLDFFSDKLQVKGDFNQFGTLIVESGFPANKPQIEVLDGNVIFHIGSETFIDGRLIVTPLRSKKRIEVNGKLLGSGTITGGNVTVPVSVVVKGGGAKVIPGKSIGKGGGAKVKLGKSIGVFTINADYTQDALASLIIEIGDTGHDQLVVNGTATVGGTVLVDFLDNFDPPAGTTFDVVSATTFIDDNFNLALVSGGLVEASVAGLPGSGQPLRLTAIDGKRYLGAGGPWDNPADWTGGTVPGAGDTAFIPGNAMTDTTVTEPAGDTTVMALVVGSGADPSNGTTTLALGGGILNATRGTTLRTNGGLAGNGTIAGNVYSAGRVAPGQSPGRMAMSGNYTQAETGTLLIELGGLTSGDEYDQLVVGGTANFLEGTKIGVTLIDLNDPEANTNPFSPALGDVFDLVVADEIFVPDANDLSPLFVSPQAQLFQPSIFLLPDNRQALRLTTIATEIPLLSDLTRNGFVDADDLFVLLANWDQVGLPGDLFLDPAKPGINADDLFVLLRDWTGPDPNPPAEAALADTAVPEPSSLVLTLLATLGLSFYRRRRRRA